MHALEILTKKRNGDELSREEITFFINGFVSDEIPDYQVSAFLMAVYFQGLSDREIFYLTDAMVASGDVLDLSELGDRTVDKHSSGGVGDKISLISLPIAAAAGVKIAKMSGRGLGFTGGTIDKLESIPGFRTEISGDEFIDIVKEVGICVVGQTKKLVPADKKIYALRDVTATVESLGLIASSIMSKKIASGSRGIVLDVKYGQGALMHDKEQARKLAEMLVGIGKQADRRVTAILTSMQQPLGRKVGNANEVCEAIDVLQGKTEGLEDVTTVALEVAGHMIYTAGLAASIDAGRAEAARTIETGAAIEKFKEWIKAQGGDVDSVMDRKSFFNPEHTELVLSKEAGYVQSIDASMIGEAAKLLGAGRETKDDEIDFSAGIQLNKKIGERVERSEVLAKLYNRKRAEVSDSLTVIENAYIIGKSSCRIDEVVGGVVL